MLKDHFEHKEGGFFDLVGSYLAFLLTAAAFLFCIVLLEKIVGYGAPRYSGVVATLMAIAVKWEWFQNGK